MSDTVTLVSYYFSHLRRGLGASDLLGAGTAGTEKRASLALKLKAGYRGNAEITDASLDVQLDINLYGPGDILGFEADKIISRVQPTAADSNFTYTNTPFIEFTEPDFLWRYSAYLEDGHFQPWLSLIVLKVTDGEKEGEFRYLKNIDPKLPRRIEVFDEGLLPDLSHSWRWAHVHLNAPSGTKRETLIQLIRQNSSLASCRLICPRRLKPGTKYAAFVVPTYKLGWETALGLRDEETTLKELSWTDAPPKEIPWYYSWEFRTCHKGDFEQLARLLEIKNAKSVGGKAINIHNPGYGMNPKPEEPLRVIKMEGALKPYSEAAQNTDERTKENIEQLKAPLEKLLRQSDAETPQVVPPIYGRWINHSDWNTPKLDTEEWLSELNLDLRFRIAAGLGAQYIKENQENLMKAAWKQLSLIQEANRQLNRGRLGMILSKSRLKRLDGQKLDKASLFELTKPIHASVNLTMNYKGIGGQERTLSEHLRASNISNLYTHEKFRKFSGKKYRKHLSQTPGRKAFPAAEVATAHASIARQTSTGGMRALDNAKVVTQDQKHFQLEIIEDVKNAASSNTLDYIARKISQHIDPDTTIRTKLGKRFHNFRDWETKKLKEWNLVNSSYKSMTEEDISPLMVYPEFHTPMYKYLLSLSPEYLIPGLENIPNNTIVPLTTNQKFVEAFLLGLNHEFASELRWREYPTNMRGSYFRKFWDTTIYSVDNNEKAAFRESFIGEELFSQLTITHPEINWEDIELAYYQQPEGRETIAQAYEEAIERWLLTRPEEKDIRPLHEWDKASKLGTHQIAESTAGTGDTLVILIRADLLRQFPNLFIYLLPKEGESNAAVYPTFEANLPPDINCLGFPINKERSREYLLILEETGSEQRYGLDASIAAGEAGESIQNLSWKHFAIDIEKGYLNDTKPEGNHAKAGWNDAAFIAKAFTQQAVRVVLDFEKLISKT